MKRFARCWTLGLAIGVVSAALARGDEPQSRPDPDPVQAAIDATIKGARQAVDRHGVSEAAMAHIKTLLSDLAGVKNIREHRKLSGLHGSSDTQAVVLASEVDKGLTLVLARFAANEPTPIHDHGTWAVLHVLEGRDQYTEWKRIGQSDDGKRAELEQVSQQILNAGQAVHWFGPPHDIHSQVALGKPTWELILAGSNMLALDRHYFDRDTGEVSVRKSQGIEDSTK